MSETVDGVGPGGAKNPPGAAGAVGDLALVLSGGGARAAYQVGVLSGIVERAGRGLRFPVMTGVSAGAIVASSLASYRRDISNAVASMERAWLSMAIERVFKTGAPSLLCSAARWLWMLGTGGRSPGVRVDGVLDTRPLRKLLAGYIHASGIDANIASGKLRALALSATDYATGRTVTFVHAADGTPLWRRTGRGAVRTRISVDHVLASSALPLVFPAIPVGEKYYGDGSIRQSAPLAPAIHLGADRLLAISTRHRRDMGEDPTAELPGYPPPAQILGMMFNALFLGAFETDSERLERINRSLAILPQGARHPDGLRPIRLVVVRPTQDPGKLASDLAHCLPGSLRMIVRGLGARGLRAPDLLSYLLFERPYVERLLEAGRRDALKAWDRIAPLLEPGGAAGSRMRSPRASP